VQGEVDATRIDIAARVDGRVGDIRVGRGETLGGRRRADPDRQSGNHGKAQADARRKLVAERSSRMSMRGTRPELIAVRKAAYEKAQANQVLAQKTYDRTYQLFQQGHSPQAQVDQMTDKLEESQRAVRAGQVRLRSWLVKRLYTREGAPDRRGQRAQSGRRIESVQIDRGPE